MDGRNPEPPKKPWGDASPVNTNKQWFPMVSKWCRISSTHSRLCPMAVYSSSKLLGGGWQGLWQKRRRPNGRLLRDAVELCGEQASGESPG